jgi:hypothetical protein
MQPSRAVEAEQALVVHLMPLAAQAFAQAPACPAGERPCGDSGCNGRENRLENLWFGMARNDRQAAHRVSRRLDNGKARQ